MTYRYYKKKGWIGWCDGCSRKVKPYSCYTYTDVDKVHDFKKIKNKIFHGFCDRKICIQSLPVFNLRNISNQDSVSYIIVDGVYVW